MPLIVGLARKFCVVHILAQNQKNNVKNDFCFVERGVKTVNGIFTRCSYKSELHNNHFN